MPRPQRRSECLTSSLRRAREIHVADVLVLCYHAVSPTWDATLSVTPEALERQLSRLVRSGWRSAPFTAAVLDPPFDRTLAITFDDAFASVEAWAAPILSRLGLTGTVFVPSAYVTQGSDLAWQGTRHWQATDHAAELAPMSWSGLGSLMEQGWEIGSHTCTHPHLTQCSDADLRAELEDSRAECERQLGAGCRALAYPYGEVDVRVQRFARRAGYDVAARLSHRLDSPTCLSWPRVGIYQRDTPLRFLLKSSRWTRRLRSSPLWYARG